MNIMEILGTILTNNKLLGAIFSTIFIILLGYFLRKKNIVDDKAGKTLSTILLSVALPALAFNSFMTNITPETFTTGLNVFIFGFVAYVLLIIISKLLYIRQKGDRKDTLEILTVFGSTTFFGIPIINAVLGKTGTLYANLFNIAYRVFLYSYGLITMSGVKFETKNLKQILLNPIIIATFLGLVIWLTQPYLPQVTVMVDGEAASFAFLRIDQTLPWVFQGFSYLGSLSSPLAWLAIGMTLASISISEAVKEKLVWVYGVMKLLVVPCIFLLIMFALNATFLPLGYEAITAIMIMLATPPATVAVAYAINFDKEAIFASNASLLTTVLAVFAIIGWIIVMTVLNTAGILV